MAPDALFDSIITFFKEFPIPATLLAIVIAVFVWKKPWEFAKLALTLAIAGIAVYLVMQLGKSTTTGVSDKYELATETEKELNRQ